MAAASLTSFPEKEITNPAQIIESDTLWILPHLCKNIFNLAHNYYSIIIDIFVKGVFWKKEGVEYGATVTILIMQYFWTFGKIFSYFCLFGNIEFQESSIILNN
jgi:hypothetical protein